MISGLIFKDGTIELSKSYTIEQGMTDHVIPGDYSIQILDTEGQLLTSIPFDASFYMYTEPAGVVETDVTAFAFVIPYPETTSEIQIQYNGEILMEFNPNTKLLHDAVDSMPDYGFINNPEQRRNAFHNKIDAIEKMLEENNINGAVQKLEHDIKDKLEKWLVDSYQVENSLQFTKKEVLDLIEEIIARLSIK